MSKHWLEPLSTAWVGVATHKLRSFLTVMGIVIGVGAVIALMSIGKGTEAQILSRIESLGSNLILVRAGATTGFGGVRGAAGSAASLTVDDALAISQEVPYAAVAAPSSSRSLQLIAGAQNTNAQVQGVTPQYQQAYNLQITEGSFLSEYDYQLGAQVAVLGSGVKETLFQSADPLGQTLRVGGNVVRVIGVLASKGASIGSVDDAIFIPLSTLQQMVAQQRTSQGERVISSIAVQVSDLKQASYVTEQIASLLRSRHQLGAQADNDFTVTSLEEIASTLSQTAGTMTLLLGSIAAISLLVGGIGVMNIMLVSVLERTREIGIRKALGAKERDIWVQFLIEAALLTFAGGIIGVAVGWGASSIVSRTGQMTTVVTSDIVILAVSVSVGIGLFFGYYPAWQASRLNPIEALRSQ
jgi:putative ABC transport system permease protein